MNCIASDELRRVPARRQAIKALREALGLYWSANDNYSKRRTILAVLVVSVGAFASALAPIALKNAVDGMELGNLSQTLYLPVAFILLYVVAQYIGRCSTELRVVLHGCAEQRVRRRIGVRLFDHLVRLPMTFHVDRQVGAICQNADQGLRGYELLITHLVYTVAPVLIEFSLVAAVLLHYQHPEYLAILSCAALAYVWAFHRWSIRVQQTSERISCAMGEAGGVMTDTLLNAETVKYFGAERAFGARYDRVLGATEDAWRSFFRTYAVNGVLVASVFAASLAASLLLAVGGVANGAMTVGDLVMVNAYVVRLVQPLELIGFAIRDVAQGTAFLAKLLTLFRQQPEGDDGIAEHGQVAKGDLTFENVDFSYRKECRVLDGVTFNVRGGSVVAIVGISGSGKSSLVRLLFRLYEPERGRILLDGVPITEMSLSCVRRAIAVVNQDVVLFHDTIARNIALGKFNASQAEIETAARLANLHDAILSMPEGYETVVGERGLKLSGGERQRIAIARAALKRPAIAVFDEATSSLDSRTEADILRNLTALSRQCTTLVIAHRLSTIIHADEILVLNAGVIVERGTHTELLAKADYYARLWDAQHSGAHGAFRPPHR